MHIKTSEFEKSINGEDPIMNDGRLQIAFIGRSNVGKSSLINSLVNKKDLVRSSPLPGMTKTVNFFSINHDSYFVDLPGYGYSRMGQKDKEHLRRLIFWYLEQEVANRIVVLIIDAKVGPTDMDMEMLQYLNEHGHEVIVVANKIDKLKTGERVRQLKEIQENIQSTLTVPYSTKTNEGREELLNLLHA